MSLIATLEGLHAPPRPRVRGDVRRAFDEVYRNRAPHAVRDFGLAGLGADVAADVDRPMTRHEKWTVAIGIAGLCISLIGTVTLARRLGRR